MEAGGLDLAYQVQGRGQSGFAFFPFSRAHFTRVGGNVLGRFNFAQQFQCVTADAASVDLDDLDNALRVNHEGTAVSQTSFFDHHAEVAGDGTSRVTNHRVLDLLNGVRSVVPCFVSEVGIGRDRVDLHAQLLEFSVVVSQVAQLGRANEGEVSRVEEDHGPLAFQVSVRHLNEFAIVVGGSIERLDFSVDVGRHVIAPW
ncbi:conserved hypothetical protein [Aeromonas veronii]|uniref:Uncharacterized protein n=1 Tax=Aeromonas veronii TaxID=654 RepID=A0A653L0C5_AERVE|nr:conserved hypothetical protein [Aeromonas veronii]